jgi:uncharacterized membrane protein
MHRVIDDRLARAMAEGYPLQLAGLLKRAWSRVFGSIGAFISGAVLWVLFWFLATFITLLFGLNEVVAGALGIVATAPVTLSVAMMGARRAAGLPVTVLDPLRYRRATAQGAIVLLVNLLATVVLSALLGPGWSLLPLIAYGLFTSLALYLVADRGLAGWDAIICSARLVRHHWPALLLLQVLLSLSLIAGGLLLGFGLMWTFPLTMIALGAVYVDAVGLRTLEWFEVDLVDEHASAAAVETAAADEYDSILRRD